MNKSILKSMVFILVLAGILSLGSNFFVYFAKEGQNAELLKRDAIQIQLMKEEKNSIDLLILGDSESYSSISPLQLWRNAGVTSFVGGQASQKMTEAMDLLKTALNTQRPKVVLLETNELFRSSSSPDRISEEMLQTAQNFFPIFRYHNVWKSQMMNTDQALTNWKGYRLRSDSQPVSSVASYMKTDGGVKTISNENKDLLSEMKKICEQNKCQLVLYSSPSPINYDMSKHNGIVEAADKLQLPYIDLNLKTAELGMDWQKDSYDSGDHLNIYGAEKVTKYMQEYLQKYSFEDHRAAASYQAWNELASAFESTVKLKKMSKTV